MKPFVSINGFLKNPSKIILTLFFILFFLSFSRWMQTLSKKKKQLWLSCTSHFPRIIVLSRWLSISSSWSKCGSCPRRKTFSLSISLFSLNQVINTFFRFRHRYFNFIFLFTFSSQFNFVKFTVLHVFFVIIPMLINTVVIFISEMS